MPGKSLMKYHLPEEEGLYSNFNMEYITDADYMHPKKSF